MEMVQGGTEKGIQERKEQGKRKIEQGQKNRRIEQVQERKQWGWREKSRFKRKKTNSGENRVGLGEKKNRRTGEQSRVGEKRVGQESKFSRDG